jgi:hypothetical protein
MASYRSAGVQICEALADRCSEATDECKPPIASLLVAITRFAFYSDEFVVRQ